jgi:hypothetical protein
LTCRGTPTFPFGDRKAQVSAILADSISGPVSQIVSAAADTSSVGRQSAFVMGSNTAGTGTVASCVYTVRGAKLKPTPLTRWAFAYTAHYTTVKQLVVTQVQRGAQVNVACKGNGCPFASRKAVGSKTCAHKAKTCQSKQPKERTVALTSLFHGARLAPGARLTVSTTKANTIANVVVFTIRAGKDASETVGCSEPGSKAVRKRC